MSVKAQFQLFSAIVVSPVTSLTHWLFLCDFAVVFIIQASLILFSGQMGKCLFVMGRYSDLGRLDQYQCKLAMEIVTPMVTVHAANLTMQIYK